jgi:hypothetical protein
METERRQGEQMVQRPDLPVAWTTRPATLCPRCGNRPGVLSEHVGEPALYAACFRTEQCRLLCEGQ